MSVFDTVKAIVGPLVGGLYFQSRFPQGNNAPDWPAILGTVITRSNDPDQCGAGTENEDDITVQMDIYADTYAEANTIRSALWVAMEAAGWMRQQGGFENFDSEAKAHRITGDWTLYQSSPNT